MKLSESLWLKKRILPCFFCAGKFKLIKHVEFDDLPNTPAQSQPVPSYVFDSVLETWKFGVMEVWSGNLALWHMFFIDLGSQIRVYLIGKTSL